MILKSFKRLDIARYLKDSRKEAGLSILDAAAQLGVTRQSLYRWESGREMPRVDVYFRLIDLYGLDPFGSSDKLDASE